MNPITPENQPSAPAVPTTQTMTHPGLPPQSTIFGSSGKKGPKKWLIIGAIFVLLILGITGIYAFTIIK